MISCIWPIFNWGKTFPAWSLRCCACTYLQQRTHTTHHAHLAFYYFIFQTLSTRIGLETLRNNAFTFYDCKFTWSEFYFFLQPGATQPTWRSAIRWMRSWTGLLQHYFVIPWNRFLCQLLALINFDWLLALVKFIGFNNAHYSLGKARALGTRLIWYMRCDLQIKIGLFESYLWAR